MSKKDKNKESENLAMGILGGILLCGLAAASFEDSLKEETKPSANDKKYYLCLANYLDLGQCYLTKNMSLKKFVYSKIDFSKAMILSEEAKNNLEGLLDSEASDLNGVYFQEIKINCEA